MVELAAADPTVTVTNFSSAVGAVPVVKAAGLTVLDSERLIWRTSLDGPALLKLHREPKRLWNELSAQDQQILEDHRGLNLTPVAVETPDGICLLVLSIKQKSEDRVTFEVMYVGERALLARYAADIANSLLPPDGAIFSVDQRFLPTAVKADAVEAFAVPRFYTAGRMDPGEIDHLYSEIVLLDLKLY